MDFAVSKALKRKKELEEELRRIEIFLAMHSEFSGTEPEDHETVIGGLRPKLALERPRGRPERMARYIYAILDDAEHPLTRTQIVEELLGRGHEIPAQDKQRYVGTILWRKDRAFVNLRGFGYWLKQKPYAPAQYVPTSSTAPQQALRLD